MKMITLASTGVHECTRGACRDLDMAAWGKLGCTYFSIAFLLVYNYPNIFLLCTDTFGST